MTTFGDSWPNMTLGTESRTSGSRCSILKKNTIVHDYLSKIFQGPVLFTPIVLDAEGKSI